MLPKPDSCVISFEWPRRPKETLADQETKTTETRVRRRRMKLLQEGDAGSHPSLQIVGMMGRISPASADLPGGLFKNLISTFAGTPQGYPKYV